ncbi:TetR/AcrR family transcriptional regulator [Actinoplanes sp. NPDC023936]|uniref:TetR/AcrR family transcriptional regulator n=1 Tax=Actinoplanes sp. NPDC023936 TaxID=3154910 RepID=UPI003411AB32
MERMGRRERQQYNRARLLDAAQRLLAQRGWSASLDEIARDAGLTKGAVYSSFASKEDILMALLDRQLGAASAELADSVPAADGDGTVRAFTALSEDNSAAGRAPANAEFAMLMLEFWLAAMRDEQVRPRYIDALRRTRARVADQIADQAGPDPETLRRTATLLLGLDIGLSIQRLIDPESVPESWYADAFRMLIGSAGEGADAS